MIVFLSLWVVVTQLCLPLITAQSSNISLVINKCPYGNSECLVKLYDSLIQALSNGNKEFNIPTLDPIFIDEFHIQTQPNAGPFDVHCAFLNAKFFGFKNSTTKKFNGFPKDFDGAENELVLHTPKYVLNGIYKANGTLLKQIPISLSGNATIKLVNIFTRLRFISRKIVKDGEIYVKAENMKMTAELHRLTIKFHYSGREKNLVEEVAEEFIRTNWKMAFDSVKESIYVSFGNIWQDIFNKITMNIPYRLFFTNE
ncbi:hypothetical protein DMENIID0001_026170 [Sergentomyia squamirostris]